MDVDQGTLATLQDNFGIANRLARMLSVELVNVEGRRAPRTDPDAVDLTMRGWSVLNGGPNKEGVQRSVALFEDALRIDPDNSQARSRREFRAEDESRVYRGRGRRGRAGRRGHELLARMGEELLAGGTEQAIVLVRRRERQDRQLLEDARRRGRRRASPSTPPITADGKGH
jgi:hypothetical protein